MKGKYTQINAEANKILKMKYSEAGIEECEIKMPGCWRNKTLGFAHRHKRNWYKSCPDLISEMSETVLACTHCHDQIEYNEKLTATIFKKLRPRVANIAAKIPRPVKALKQKAKKPDWMRPHKCKCGHITSFFICEKCHKISV